MTDLLLENQNARKLIKTLGLPIPVPERLARSKAPYEERPLDDKTVLVGGAGGLQGGQGLGGDPLPDQFLRHQHRDQRQHHRRDHHPQRVREHLGGEQAERAHDDADCPPEQRGAPDCHGNPASGERAEEPRHHHRAL